MDKVEKAVKKWFVLSRYREEIYKKHFGTRFRFHRARASAESEIERKTEREGRDNSTEGGKRLKEWG